MVDIKLNLQAGEEQLKHVRRGIENTSMDVRAIRNGIATIQQQTNDLQITNNHVSSALETRLEDLPKLKNTIDMLPELLEKLLKIEFEEHWQKQ